MSRSNLQIPLIFSILLLVSTSPTAIIADDQVSITIQMSGDAYVTITNSNGTIIFNYNGENIMPELLNDVDWLKIRVNSNQLALELMRKDFNRLVKALNGTFKDLYGKVYFLAHVTGIYNGNENSTVTLMLKSGNVTLADFIDQLFNATEKLASTISKHDIQIKKIELRIASDRQEVQRKIAEAYDWILENRKYFATCLSEMNEKLEILAEKLNATSSNLNVLEATVERVANITKEHSVQIEKLKKEMLSNQQKTKHELANLSERITANKEQFESQLTMINAKLNATEKRINSLSDNVSMKFTRILNDLEAMKTYEQVNIQSTLLVMACLGILNLILVALVIWIAGWKAKTL